MPPKTAPTRLTHFLCLPLVTAASRPQLTQSLHAFRADIKDDRSPANPHGIPEKAVRPVGTIHLTLGVMSLLASERVEGALALLRGLDLSALLSTSAPGWSKDNRKDAGVLKNTEPSPLRVTLRGLMSMHSPANTSVLYSSPEDPDGRLYAFCTVLRDAFSEYMVPDTRPLLLHATILNTVYVPAMRNRSSVSGAGHGRNKAKMTIDAREIIERYSEVMWIEDMVIDKVTICRMGARNIKDEDGKDTDDQEYLVEGQVDMPDVK